MSILRIWLLRWSSVPARGRRRRVDVRLGDERVDGKAEDFRAGLIRGGGAQPRGERRLEMVGRAVNAAPMFRAEGRRKRRSGVIDGGITSQPHNGAERGV